jgi:RNA polymerase sigma factor for flagellar operon FliA
VVERLQQLPDMQRKVMAMYYFEELRLSEIAAAFGVTEGRISQIHTQAVQSLRGFIHRQLATDESPAKAAA